MKNSLTVGDIARHFKAPQWKVRRIVDSIGRNVTRVGQYRLVPRQLLPEIEQRLNPSDKPVVTASEASP